ncbi:hypothetical protein ABPG73_006701 [Tetrahymena malaccensis]
MDQLEKVDFSDIEKFLVACYVKCPIHKRSISFLRLDDKEDPQVLKCFKCLDKKKFKSFVEIVELFQSDNYFSFQKWPIHDDDIQKKLKKIIKWPFTQYCEDINLIFDEIIEKIQLKRKEILKNLGEFQEIKQKPLDYFKLISKKDKLVEIIKSQFGDQKKQNEMILKIIKENQLNYESNKKKLLDLIDESNENIFDLTTIKNFQDEVLSLINNFSSSFNQQDNEIVEQSMISNSNSSQDEIKQKPIMFYNEISKKEKLTELIKTLYVDQSKQNKIIQEIIVENQLNYESNKKQLTNLIKEANQYDFNLNKIKSMKDKILSKINKLDIFTYSKNNQIAESPNKIQEVDSNQMLEEISINKPEDINQCYNCKKIEINFSNNNIGNKGTQYLANTIEKNQKFSDLELKLEGNQIYDEGAISISNGIKEYKQITELTLCYRENNIGNLGFFYLSRAIKNFQKIKILNLCFGDNNITDLGAFSILNAIENYKKIDKLELFLWKNNISYDVTRAIAKLLQNFKNLSNLELNLNDNNIGIEGAKLIMEEIEKKIENIQELSLNLIEHNLMDNTLEELKDTFNKCKDISELILDLSCNNIDDQGALSILQAAKNQKYITNLDLDLWDNNLSQETSMLIAKYLKSFHNLFELDLNLEDNNIGIEGSKFIMEQH